MPFTHADRVRGGKHSARRDIVTRCIISALESYDPETGLKKCVTLANRLVGMALKGDMVAIKEVLDRAEGKPMQYQENHNFTRSASEMSDDELAAFITGGSGAGNRIPSSDPETIQ